MPDGLSKQRYWGLLTLVDSKMVNRKLVIIRHVTVQNNGLIAKAILIVHPVWNLNTQPEILTNSMLNCWVVCICSERGYIQVSPTWLWQWLVTVCNRVRTEYNSQVPHIELTVLNLRTWCCRTLQGIRHTNFLHTEYFLKLFAFLLSDWSIKTVRFY